MRVVHAGEAFPDEISVTLCLLGPDAPHGPGEATSWRREALRHLQEAGFAGEVFVPGTHDPLAPLAHDGERAWQDEALQRSDHILVGAPDDSAASHVTLASLALMDAWGFWKGRDPGRLILVAPGTSALAAGLRQDARDRRIPVCDTIADACRLLVAAGSAIRRGGEVHVPLHVWRTPSFQSWYKAQRDAGNALCGGHLEWLYRLNSETVLYWAMQADLRVAVEDRRKANEVVLGRPDLAAIVLHRPAPDRLDTEVVLVREFRSPARTPDGYHLGLPSGSSPAFDQDPLTVAQHEVCEETGLDIPAARLRRHPDRQLLGTLATHHACLFSAELTPAEIAAIRAREAARQSHGVAADTERTYPCVRTVREILADRSVDWSTVGMVLAVLGG